MAALVLGRPELFETDISASVLTLIAQTEARLRSADTVAAHNAFTIYVAVLLLTTTGHRPVRDPFCDRRSISLTHACAVIDDKAVSERHRHRMVWLCDSARDQIAAYDAHRRNFANYLPDSPHPAAMALASYLRDEALPTEQPVVPYLFLVGSDYRTESVRPKRIRAAVGGTWPLPLNVGRYLIATGLRRFGVPEQCISATLNHLHDLFHPYGPSSLLSPRQCGSLALPALQRLADEQKWKVLTGLPARERDHGGSPVHPSAQPPRQLHEHRLLGPQLREVQRRRRRDEDIEAVRAVLAKTDLVDLAAHPPRIDELREELINAARASGERTARRLALFWRWLRRHGGARLQRHLPRRLAVPEPESSPFRATQLDDLRSGHRLAAAFAAHLASQGDQGAQVQAALRSAEICLYAALWGGVTDPQRLAGLVQSLPDGIDAVHDAVWVEVPRTGDPRPLWRWFPDAPGRAMLQGLRRAMTDRQRNPGTDRITKILSNLLDEWRIGSSSTSPYQRVARAAAGLWTQYGPPLARDLASGATVTQPLPLPALVRLLTRNRALLNEVSAATTASTPAWLPPITTTSELRAGFMARLRETIADAERAAPVGHQRRAGAVRGRLAQNLRALGKEGWPSTPALLIAWGVHLCIEGTRQLRELAAETPGTYLSTVLNPLCESAWDEDLLICAPPDLEDIYERAMSYSSRCDDGAYLGGRLEEFQAFCATYLGLADVDNNVFVPAAGSRQPRLPDAGILLPWEYDRVLELLAGQEEPPTAERLRDIALVIIGYRFGLRSGEASELLAVDLCMESGELCYLHVHASVFGDRKSPAATRLVPLIGSLSPREQAAIESLYEHGCMLASHDDNAPLFGLEAGSRNVADLHQALRRIHAAMRQVTGDPRLHFHHLRHSFACRIFAALAGPVGVEAWTQMCEALAFPDASTNDVRRLLTGTDRLQNSTFWALSTILGHADVRTTFAHYLHLCDAWLPGSLRLPL